MAIRALRWTFSPLESRGGQWTVLDRIKGVDSALDHEGEQCFLLGSRG